LFIACAFILTNSFSVSAHVGHAHGSASHAAEQAIDPTSVNQHQDQDTPTEHSCHCSQHFTGVISSATVIALSYAAAQLPDAAYSEPERNLVSTPRKPPKV
jgi:hypothetical protein